MRPGPVLTIASLLTLSGCSSAPIIQTRAVYVRPPTEMVQRCPVPPFNGDTYRALLSYTVDLRADLQACDARAKSLQQWIKESPK